MAWHVNEMNRNGTEKIRDAAKWNSLDGIRFELKG